jgi:hypothetical protein
MIVETAGARAACEADVVVVTVEGRVTREAMEVFGAALTHALATERPFAVLFDRRAMTATTKEGRVAVEQWAAEFLPRLAGPCRAWADLFDVRRAASLARASARRAEDDQDSPPDTGAGYPQRTFDDASAARTWLRDRLEERP